MVYFAKKFLGNKLWIFMLFLLSIIAAWKNLLLLLALGIDVWWEKKAIGEMSNGRKERKELSVYCVSIDSPFPRQFWWLGMCWGYPQISWSWQPVDLGSWSGYQPCRDSCCINRKISFLKKAGLPLCLNFFTKLLSDQSRGLRRLYFFPAVRLNTEKESKACCCSSSWYSITTEGKGKLCVAQQGHNNSESYYLNTLNSEVRKERRDSILL